MTLQKRLRASINDIRRKPYPISDIIPLLVQAADMLDALERQQEKPSWELEPSAHPCGLVQYMTDSKYKMQTPGVQRWYRLIRPDVVLPDPFKVQNAGNSYDEHDNWSEGYDEGWNECLAEVKRMNNL